MRILTLTHRCGHERKIIQPRQAWRVAREMDYARRTLCPDCAAARYGRRRAVNEVRIPGKGRFWRS
jgi:hypothetical protein